MTREERILRRRRAQRERRAYLAERDRERAAQRRKNRQRRRAEAVTLTGATRFSEDRVLCDPVLVVELFKRWAPGTCLELDRATSVVNHGPGAPRRPGSWALAFLAHVLSGSPDWQPWYHANQGAELWQACGFDAVPSYQTVYLRFRELEHPRFVAAFDAAAAFFIRLAARREPRTYEFVHVDGSALHSHSRLVHACPNEAYCATRDGQVPQALSRASEDTINGARHESSAKPEPADPDASPDRSIQYLTDEEARDLGLSDWQNSRYVRFGPRGHILRCRDKDAGVRKYDKSPRKRVAWVGGYFLPGVSGFWAAPLAAEVFGADQQEHLGWPTLHRKLNATLNENPDQPTRRITGVVADRAFTNKTFIAYNTNEGIASITPERGLPGGRDWTTLRDPEGRWDEYGPRCRYCGGTPAAPTGPGEGFAITGSGDPRLSFRCSTGFTPECSSRLQTISCRREPRALLPIARTQRVYQDLLVAHSHYEGVFDAWRDRYAVAGTSVAKRSKRRLSLPAQRLRIAAALLAEWLRICLRMGYIGNHAQRNHEEPRRCYSGAARASALRQRRESQHLHLPIGPAARRLGFITSEATDPALAPHRPPPG